MLCFVLFNMYFVTGFDENIDLNEKLHYHLLQNIFR